MEHVVHPEGTEALQTHCLTKFTSAGVLHTCFLTKLTPAGVSWVSEVRGKKAVHRMGGAGPPSPRGGWQGHPGPRPPPFCYDGPEETTWRQPCRCSSQTEVQACGPGSVVHPEGCQLCHPHEKAAKAQVRARTPSKGHLVSPKRKPHGRGVGALRPESRQHRLLHA